MATKHALIIEDDVNSARVLVHLLNKQNIESTVVTNTSQLESYLDIETDIVFVDLEMPNMSGYDVLDWLNSTANFANVPIVASSVHTSEVDHVRQAGFHAFIGKPLAKERFPDQLQRILEGEHIWEVS